MFMIYDSTLNPLHHDIRIHIFSIVPLGLLLDTFQKTQSRNYLKVITPPWGMHYREQCLVSNLSICS